MVHTDYRMRWHRKLPSYLLVIFHKLTGYFGRLFSLSVFFPIAADHVRDFFFYQASIVSTFKPGVSKKASHSHLRNERVASR